MGQPMTTPKGRRVVLEIKEPWENFTPEEKEALGHYADAILEQAEDRKKGKQ